MKSIFFFGDWQVDPTANTLRKGKLQRQLEPKAMDVLLLLCQQQGEVLSTEEIINHCWPNTAIGDNPLHKTLTQLRQALDDSATKPLYIETIRKRGYRTIATVRFPLGQEQSATEKSWQHGSPFPGLQAYNAKYANVFFGRGAQIDTLLQRITQQVKYGRDFCLILGPSGCGKSSLINAGILPNLMQPGGYNGIEVVSYSSLDLADTAPENLLLDLASALLDWDSNDEPVFSGDSASALAAKLLSAPSEVLAHCGSVLGKNTGRTRRFALFIDRLEVVLSAPQFSADERTTFIALLEQLATSGTVLVLAACRNEFYPQLVEYPSLMTGKARGAHFDLAAPGRTELLQMIRLPALAAGLTFEVDTTTAMPLDEILCSEAASNPDALPMLQYTLQELYLKRSSDNKLRIAVYQKLGGIEGAIGKNAEDAIKHLTPQQTASLPAVLSHLVTLREYEQSITSRTGRFSQLQTDAEQTLVQTLIEQRLFVSHLQNGEPCFSIAHEALLRRWPRATAWITAHHDSLSVKSRLHHLSQRWRAEQQNSAYLLAAGKPLQEALALGRNPLFQLDQEESHFIKASARKARVMRWLRHCTIAALCLLTFTAVTMSFRSFQAEQQAQQKRLAAESLLGFMVGEFADKLRSIGRMDLLDGISNKALEYFSDYSSVDDHLSVEARFQHGQTLEAIGEVAYSRGKQDEAISALHAARIKLTSVFIEQPDDTEVLKVLGANAFWLGQIHYDNSDWLAAQPEFELYYHYSERMFQLAPDSREAIMELSYATSSLGSLAISQQRFAQAKINFEESLKLKLQAKTDSPNSQQLLSGVANTRSWLASVALAQGDLKSAITIHQQIQQELAAYANTADPYLLDILSSSYQMLADLFIYQNNLTEAQKSAQLGAQSITRAIEQDSDNSYYQQLRYYSYFLSFKLSMANDLNSIEKQLTWLSTRLQADNTLIPATTQQEILARHYLLAAQKLQQHGFYTESLSYADFALESFQSLPQTQNARFLLYLINSELTLAKALAKTNQSDKAQQLCQKNYTILAPIVKENKDPKYSRPYAQVLDCLGLLATEYELIQILKKNNIDDFNF